MAGFVLGAALLSTALAQVSYKFWISRNRARSVLLIALGLFAAAQVGFFVSLTTLEVGLVYMSTGLIHVAVLLLSYFVLEERLTMDHWIAVALIGGGLVIYAQ